jgi:tetraprenyl-beta-curcumene synthase
MSDPLPLSIRQLRALATATLQQLLWGLHMVSSELRRWRSQAREIPDVPLREDALETLARKRPHIFGAGLFSILSSSRDPRLLRLLVAYEIILEYLDNAHERAGERRNGHQLHLALVEALDPSKPISDYYLHHPWKNDGGYLRGLVETCREGCISMSSYKHVRRGLLLGASRCGGVQSLNHEVGAAARVLALRGWCESQFPGEREESWWETTAAASSSLVVHALLATAARGRQAWEGVDEAYVPWICAVSTLLDSYVDEPWDVARGEHSYIGYYESPEDAQRRLSELIHRAAGEARGLPGGHRHAVITACMVAMYMSNERLREPAMRASTDRLIAAGGSLTRVLVPVLRAWRVTYAVRSA